MRCIASHLHQIWVTSFTLIWCLCAWEIDIDGKLKRGTSCGGVVLGWLDDLGIFGGGVLKGSRF